MQKSCTIIVFNYESLGFLKLCIKQIRKHRNNPINQHVIIADQSGIESHNEVVKEFGDNSDIEIVHMKALRSGYAVDYVMRNIEIKTDYVCTLDCDAFVISDSWLSLPITLCEEEGFKFIGGLFFESRREETAHFLGTSNFYCLSQCYRIGRTVDYKELSMEGGFTILHARSETGFTYGNNDWLNWAEEDYINRGSDDGTIAHCWEDNNRKHNKLSLATTHTMGDSKIESGYGGIIDGLVLHFSFSFWSNGIEDKVGKEYGYWKQRINEGDENVLEEMLAVAKKNPSDPYHVQGTHVRGVWNGTLKKSYPSCDKLNKRIEELKQ